MRKPTARSLVLNLLSTLRGQAMPVAALVAAGELFDVAENSMRVAIARLLAAGRVERDERGQYRLGEASAPVDRQVRAWRRLDERVVDWDGAWVGGAVGHLPRPASRELHRREQALRLLGFEALAKGLWVRPDNLRGGVAALRAELGALGLDGGALVFRMDDLDAEQDARARALWNGAALLSSHERSLRDIELSARELPALPEADAMVESYLLGGRIIRELVLDPLLPEAIVPTEPRQALVDAMREYDALGRRSWAQFMARHGAPNAGTPADVQRGDPAETWSLH